MRSIRGAACAAVVSFMCLISAGVAFAQSQDSYYPAVRDAWHQAGLLESRNDWVGAENAYQKTIDESSPLPLNIREWFRGTAAYGLGRCAARLQNGKNVRAYLAYAFDHHFWNSSLIKLDSQVVAVAGPQWLDSVSNFWRTVCNAEQVNWRPQEPYIFYPNGYDSSSPWPLIIAMHGGNANFENFAEYWRPMASVLKAVIVVPPGEVRESEITNSWGADMRYIEQPILRIAHDMISKRLVDPTQVYLSGFSQGAQASIELTIMHPELFRGAIAMSGFTSEQPTDSALRIAHQHGVRIYALTGEFEDPTFRKEIGDAHSACVAKGIPFELTIVPGMIHEVPIDFPTLYPRAWDWIRMPDRASAPPQVAAGRNGQN